MKDRVFAHRFVLVLLLGIVVTLSACATPLAYSAKEIRGQIVDNETSQPIAGAVIVAQWVLLDIGSGSHKIRLQVYETVTDAGGSYVIPEWGPKARPPMTELHHRDPEILVFKSGYEPEVLANTLVSAVRRDSLRVSEWNGKVVRLKRFQGTLEACAVQILYRISTSLPEADKAWKSFPRMVLALDAEDRRLKSLGLKPNYRATSFVIDYFDEGDRNFLRKFEK